MMCIWFLNGFQPCRKDLSLDLDHFPAMQVLRLAICLSLKFLNVSGYSRWHWRVYNEIPGLSTRPARHKLLLLLVHAMNSSHSFAILFQILSKTTICLVKAVEGSRLRKEDTVSNFSHFYNDLKFTQMIGKLTSQKISLKVKCIWLQSVFLCRTRTSDIT